VERVKKIAAQLREGTNYKKNDFRICCNSKDLDEKLLAEHSGIGSRGINSIVISKEFGSLFVIAVLVLPWTPVSGKSSMLKPLFFCDDCDSQMPPCKTACPTGAITGDGNIDRKSCVQWYASGHEDTVPEKIKQAWNNTLYGCTRCQDACLHGRARICGAESSFGLLPAVFDAKEILAKTDEELKALIKGSALGLSWLCPHGLRRNARICLEKL
jgi:epoxyqueuosine reductase